MKYAVRLHSIESIPFHVEKVRYVLKIIILVITLTLRELTKVTTIGL